MFKNFIQQYKNAKTCVEQLKNGEWKFADEYEGAEEYRLVRGDLYLWIKNGPWWLNILKAENPLVYKVTEDYFGYIFRHYVWYFGVKKYMFKNKEVPILK